MKAKISINSHSSIRAENGTVVYFDPFNISDETHDADIIFFTHDHYDHLSPDDSAKVAKSDTVYVMPSSSKNAAVSKGICEKNIITLDAGDEREMLGVSVLAVRAYNEDKKFHPKQNGWLGYVISLNGEKIYVAGDSDALAENENIVCDTALLPIGGTYTMDCMQAAKFAKKLNPSTVIPTHYGSVVGQMCDAEKFAKLVGKDVNVEILIK